MLLSYVVERNASASNPTNERYDANIFDLRYDVLIVYCSLYMIRENLFLRFYYGSINEKYIDFSFLRCETMIKHLGSSIEIFITDYVCKSLYIKR